MLYLILKIISIPVMLLILFTVIITRNTDRERSNRRLIARDKRRNRKRENSRDDTPSERYLADCKTMEFFDDSKSSDPEKKRVGSHFWIKSHRESDGVQLSLYKDNWGAEADYMMSEDGFVESIKTVKGYDMQRLMVLCDFAQNGGEVWSIFTSVSRPTDTMRILISFIGLTRTTLKLCPGRTGKF